MHLARGAVLGLLVLTSAAGAQPQFPDTLAGKAFSEYLSALNTIDRERIESVLTKYRIPFRVDGQVAFAQATGGFAVLRIEQSFSNELTALLAERNSDALAQMTITVSTDGAGQITATKLSAQGVPRQGELAIPRMTGADALKAFEMRAEEHARQDRFSGAYLIAEDGKVRAAKAYGWADREAKMPNTLHTKFRIGSMNKMFTAIATLQLVQAGKISLDGTVGAYLPDYPNRDVATKVTVRQLLTHTGGTGDFFGPEFDANRLNLKTHKDYITLLGARPPEFEPGSKDAYSNFGFLILGNIIESVSGQTYFDYVSQHVFKPAGMSDTGSLPEEQGVPMLAKPYMRKNGAWALATETLPYSGTSAGGGYSTVSDLFKFAQALESGKLLARSLLAEATTPHNHTGNYGYGFDLPRSGPKSFGHGGGSQGMNAHLYVFPDLKRVVITVSNFDPAEADSLAGFYVNRMPATG